MKLISHQLQLCTVESCNNRSQETHWSHLSCHTITNFQLNWQKIENMCGGGNFLQEGDCCTSSSAKSRNLYYLFRSWWFFRILSFLGKIDFKLRSDHHKNKTIFVDICWYLSITYLPLSSSDEFLVFHSGKFFDALLLKVLRGQPRMLQALASSHAIPVSNVWVSATSRMEVGMVDFME